MPTMFLRLRSFRLRIAVLTTLVSGIVLIAFGVATYGAMQRMSMRRIDESIRDIAQRQLGGRQGPRHWDRMAESLEYLGAPGESLYVLHVMGRNGDTLFTSPDFPKQLVRDLFPAPDTLVWQDEPRLSDGPPPGRRGGRGPWLPGEEAPGPFRGGPPSVPVRQLGYVTSDARGKTWRVGGFATPDATLVLAANLDQYNRDILQLRKAYVIVMPVALCLIALGGWWIAQRALRPVRRLTLLMEGVTAKGLDLRIPASGEAAEFDRLVAVFNDMLDRLEVSFRQAVRFSADAAHELKTPLTVLQGELEQNLQSCDPGSERQQAFSRLLEEVQRLKSIVRKLLLLSLADSGQLLLHLEPVNLSEMVDAVCDDVEILAPRLMVERTITPDVWVAADPELLEQIIQNLTSNAMKYNVTDGTIRVELASAETTALLTIGNSGPGIPEEDRGRVFERFYRADKARNRRIEGAGLGLSLAREIARAHRGDLRLLASEPGWTSFRLSLPLQAQSPPRTDR